ncbi:O-methyltransferase family protein [Chytriomyces sp. MP71]|nr:O-methyltransferase family protein [Chytriomyces sp. MP71]
MLATDAATWIKTDTHLASLLLPSTPSDPFDAALASHARFNLPEIAVSPLQGAFLSTLVRATRARRVLEVGTLAGYSTLWLAKGLGVPGAPAAATGLPAIVTLELEEKHAHVARENLARAGISGQEAELRVGPAVESLRQLVSEGQSFDFVFIDADKQSYADYFDLVLQLSRVGTTIISDNVVRQGKITDPTSKDEKVVGVQRFLKKIQASPFVESSVLQTVGCKGHDGFAISVVTTLPSKSRL